MESLFFNFRRLETVDLKVFRENVGRSELASWMNFSIRLLPIGFPAEFPPFQKSVWNHHLGEIQLPWIARRSLLLHFRFHYTGHKISGNTENSRSNGR